MKTVFVTALAAFSFCLPFTAAQADTAWPKQRPVNIVVPFPPGGATDQIARQLGFELENRLGQTFVVENRAGAGGSVGSRHVARSKPDGYTILMGTNSSHAIAPIIHKDLPYDPLKDFAPITLVAKVPQVLMVHPSLPVENLSEFIDYAKSNPGKVNFGTGGIGTPAHLGLELFKLTADISMEHVPFQGGNPAMMALMGGQIQLVSDDINSALSHIESGAVRPIAVTTTERTEMLLPDIGTIQEQGVNIEYGSWFALFAPAGTPDNIVNELNQAVKEALGSESVLKVLNTQGAQPQAGTQKELEELMISDISKWRRVAAEANLE